YPSKSTNWLLGGLSYYLKLLKARLNFFNRAFFSACRDGINQELEMFFFFHHHRSQQLNRSESRRKQQIPQEQSDEDSCYFRVDEVR
ncbi:hypothetical protein, partial [Ileibacterium valens]|uniref:hypothetical protein n=1 Tax=Ileibacterium valens TaxID=1862668 RepID=UPI0025705080